MKKRVFIDLFAGCGGLSLGLMQAGWQGLFAVEKSTDAFATLRHNLCAENRPYRFDWPDWLPCKARSTRSILRSYRDELQGLRGKVDLIAGGPPCQGFSSAGLRNPDDPRNRLTDEYIRIVRLVRPKFLLLENVKGFQATFSQSDEPYSARVVRKLSELEPNGYHIHYAMLDAGIFGVPQPRSRFIMIGVRHDIGDFNTDPFKAIVDAVPTFREERGLNGHLVTVRQAISDLEITGKILIPSPETNGFEQIEYKPRKKLSNYQKFLRHGLAPAFAPNSLRLPNHAAQTRKRFQHILNNCPRGKKVPKEYRDQYNMKKQCITPLHPDKPAHTVTTLPDDMIHYREPRILTVRENARLQSFPDWFEFKGKYTTGGNRRRHECPRYTQVGNAVPPLMAQAIGLSLLELAAQK